MVLSGGEGYRAGADGTVSGLLVAGFYGKVRPGATPAIAGPMLVDEVSGRTVKVALTGIDELLILELGRSVGDGHLPVQGTAAGPWPARRSDVFVILGPDDMELMPAVERAARTTCVGGGFFRWAASGEVRSEEQRAERLSDGTVAWYCSSLVASSLRASLARALYDVMIGELARSPGEVLAHLGWRLSRSATSHGTVALACAAVRRAGDPGWRSLLREGMPHLESADREAYLREAERQLDEEAYFREVERQLDEEARGLR